MRQVDTCAVCSRPYKVRPELRRITKYCKRLDCIKARDRANQARLRQRKVAGDVD